MNHETNIEDKFRQLCEAAYEIDLSTVNCQDYEPHMIEIIHLVTSNPQYRETFVRCFKSLVDGEARAPVTLVPYCMRQLRFPEIYQLVRERLRGPDDTERYRRAMNYWADIIRAYEDGEWEDADMSGHPS